MPADNSAQRPKCLMSAVGRETVPELPQDNAAGQRFSARGGTEAASDCMTYLLVKRPCVGESNPPIATATRRRLSENPVPGDNP
jgi:hypothetical protein